MPTMPRKTSPHVQARRRLLALLRKLAAAGERQLPGERQLCKELDVCSVTMRRVLRQLVGEGRVICVPRVGSFLGEVPEYHNLGVVTGDGSTVAFIHGASTISGILDACSHACVHLRSVQLRAPERAARVLGDYGLDGCIWSVPDAAQLRRVKQAVATTSVPVVVVVHASCAPADLLGIPGLVTYDFRAIGALRARYLLERGHRAIAYLHEPQGEAWTGFREALAAAGADPPDTDVDSHDLPGSVGRILDQGGTTALIVDGGPADMARVLQAVEAHPAGGQVELLLDHIGAPLTALLERHPRLRIAGINRYAERELGQAAVRLILGHMRDGTPLAHERCSSHISAPP